MNLDQMTEAAKAFGLLPQDQPAPSKQKDVLTVYEALAEGPGTSGELAAELGWPVKTVSAYLSALYAGGMVERTGEFAAEPGGRKSFIYSLPAATTK